MYSYQVEFYSKVLYFDFIYPINATWPITAVAQFRLLVPDFPPQRPRFTARLDHVTCAGSSPITSVSSEKYHSANCSTSLFTLSSTLYRLDVDFVAKLHDPPALPFYVQMRSVNYEILRHGNLFRVPQHHNELMNNVLNCFRIWKVRSRDTVRKCLRITFSYSNDSSIWQSHIFSHLHIERP